MWFAAGGSQGRGGVSRYDGKEFVNLTTKDGLAYNSVSASYRTPDGVMWFGTEGGGVSRYDGRGVTMGDFPHFVSFTTKDGLAHNWVRAIHRDPDGVMWFGTYGGGVSRYDGEEFVNFTTKDGLVSNRVEAIYGDTDGVMWFGTMGGVSRYDGKEFVNFTKKDGLAHNNVGVIHRDPDGVMWFGTGYPGGGVSRYDGKEFANVTTKDGLAHNMVYAIHRDPDGVMWFGTEGGVSRYDGEEFVNVTKEDGLAHNAVAAIHRDPDGVMWFGTWGGGVSRYDGTAWTSLDTRDGLAGNNVLSIHQDSEGFLWFATEGGITRYRPSTTPPKVRIVSVTTDQTYGDLSAIPAFTIGTRVTIQYGALDYRTLLEKQQYRYRIKEADSDWRRPTKATLFDYTFKKPGNYTFEVEAIDRDLNYSDPASVPIVISAPPFYQTGIFLIALSIIVGTSLSGVIILAVQRRRSSRAHKVAEQIQAAKMGSLRQLVAGVAHQINNPVGAISSNNDISSRAIGRIKQLIAGEHLREMAEGRQLVSALTILETMNQVSQTASRGIAETVANLRSFVRLDEAEWQLADIHEGIDSVIALMESEFSGRISVTRDYGDIPRIHCSPSDLNQAFISLLRNASEAIAGRGEIHVRTSVQGKYVKIEVSDTGNGIPSDDMDRIFDPGFTTKGVRVGVGLGLSICYKIVVDEHKGRIDVSSEPGMGATFAITLPQYHDETGKTR